MAFQAFRRRRVCHASEHLQTPEQPSTVIRETRPRCCACAWDHLRQVTVKSPLDPLDVSAGMPIGPPIAGATAVRPWVRLRRVGNLARFDLVGSRTLIRRSGPIPIRLVCVIALVVGSAGAATVSTARHAEHDTDPSCVVCKVRHEPLAELAGDLQVGPVGAPEPATSMTSATWIPADPDAQVPTRAPPHS